MYHYPAENLHLFSELLEIHPSEHTMGTSLQRYLEIKVHPLVDEHNYTKVIVRGKFERAYGISSKEKNNKLFNYMRPTAEIENSVLYLNCFPGLDYVFHYGNILKSYMAITGQKADIIHDLPSEKDCWKAISESELQYIPKPYTVIMGALQNEPN